MAGAGLSRSRRLLRRVRKVMASSVTPQERLDQLVRIIATGFAADVCSVYVMRPGNILELFATKGLKRKAVHVTRLRVGEGVVGDIAAHATTLALSEASSHPSYSYRPETGEEKFHSMLGVPILRGGLVIGVLVVQHVAHRKYTEEESETLQTLAMILAEMVAEGGLVTTREQRLADGIGLLPLRLEGIQLSPGMASGFAVLHEPRLIIHDPIAEDPEVELKRLGEAMAGMFSALDDLFSLSKLDQGEAGDILESYRMFAEDRGWAKRIREAVETGLIAEAAVQKVQEDTRARMSQIADPYLRERLHDFDDLANRLLRHLSGKIRTSASMDMPEDVILVARAMGPAELLEYDPHRLKALVLEEGSQTAHVAIIARDMDIPVLGHVKGALERIGLLEPLIVDTDNEQIIVRPGGETLRVFENNIRERAQRRAAYDALRDRPAVTRDGVCVSLNINAGLLADLPQMQACGADGIGLYRTEIPFMVRSTFPDVDAQTTLYKKVLDRTGGSPVVFRTLDVGSDKTLPYLRMEDQENPAMGWRSVRIGLDRPSMLRQQLRALIRAAARRHLDVTFPMIAEISEFMAAKDILQLELDRAKSRKEPLPKDIRIGSMIEVPALVWQLPGLKGKVDFLSVGSNDLIQFFFASDRGNPHLTGRYDTLSPAFLSLLRQIVDICNEADIALGLCGEMAGRPLEAMALVGLGFRNLSMSPSAMGPVKNMILGMECEPLREFLDMLCRSSDHSVRDKLRMYARDHGIAI